MPRKARIDAPGALHHIICRGLERRNIFRDDTDGNRFVGRLAKVLLETATPCFACALIPNRFHLLLKTGKAPIAKVIAVVRNRMPGGVEGRGLRGPLLLDKGSSPSPF